MGIMGKRNRIENIEITGELFDEINELMISNLNESLEKAIKISKSKNVYCVTTKNNSYRLDLYFKYSTKNFKYQDLAYKNKINVPKIIQVFSTVKGNCKISEWIYGKRIGYFWDDMYMFKKCGELLGKLNTIKDNTTNLFLSADDFSKPNVVMTEKNEVFIIDVIIKPRVNIDGSIFKILKDHIKEKVRINNFLKGYFKYRNCDHIKERVKKELKINLEE